MLGLGTTLRQWMSHEEGRVKIEYPPPISSNIYHQKEAVSISHHSHSRETRKQQWHFRCSRGSITPKKKIAKCVFSDITSQGIRNERVKQLDDSVVHIGPTSDLPIKQKASRLRRDYHHRSTRVGEIERCQPESHRSS